MTLTGTMARRPEDSTNWGGARPGSGRQPLWNVPKGTPGEVVKLPTPIKDALLKVRDKGVSMEAIVEKLEELLK